MERTSGLEYRLSLELQHLTMHSKVFIVLLGLVAIGTVNAAPGLSSEEASSESVESSEVSYSFIWAVEDESSENYFGHQEAREDDDTQGSYYVQLPDGRLQKVSYNVDSDEGYVADVTYEGEAEFPSAESYESSESSESVESNESK